LNGSHANGNNPHQLLRKELGASPSDKKKEENTMGILKKLIELKKRRGALTIDTVDVDDVNGVTKEIWLLFFPRGQPFASITEEEITVAIREAYPNVDVGELLKELGPRAKYTKNSQADFSELFKNILSKIGKYTVTRVPKPLSKIKPGSGIKGASDDSGSIGGFLINHKREIFLFSDAHVLTRTLNTAIDKVTPESFTNKVIVKDVAIGAVVCSCQIQVHGHQNYDMALAKIDSEYYKYISLQYRGSKSQRSGGNSKSFFVTKVDYKLCEEKRVFLFGHTSGYVEGKLLTCEPADHPEAPYGKLLGEKTDQNITLHDCIVAQALDADITAIQGDSGGLWVNETGGAVGIQVIVQGDIAVIHPMALVMAYFHRHYDGSLRFLTPNDLSEFTAF
jgi:hypothetical protein